MTQDASARHDAVLIPEYWLLASDNDSTLQQLEELVHTGQAPMMMWRRKYGLVRTLETGELEGEVARLIAAGSPCVHILLSSGERGLDLRLRAIAPPRQRYRVVVRRLDDESRRRLLGELTEPDSWPLLTWHFGRHRSIPDLPTPPELAGLSREHRIAFEQWASTLTPEDLDDYYDRFGNGSTDEPAEAEDGPTRDQPEPGNRWDVPALPIVELGSWAPPSTIGQPAALAASTRGAESLWVEQARWSGPAGKTWSAVLMSRDGTRGTEMKVVLTLFVHSSEPPGIQVWLTPRGHRAFKLVMGHADAAIRPGSTVVLESRVPDEEGLKPSDFAGTGLSVARLLPVSAKRPG